MERGGRQGSSLKGKDGFKCPLCTRVFAHSASLSRHRLRVHNGCHYCLECKEGITASTTLRGHFSLLHGLSAVFTCACCNWAFSDKKALHGHIKTVARGEVPSLTNVLAITDADHARLAHVDTVTPPTTVSSSSTVLTPVLPSVSFVQSEDWQIPVGLDDSSPDLDLLVGELVKDNNLMMQLLTTTLQENIRLNEMIHSLSPPATVTASLHTNALSSVSPSFPSRSTRYGKSIDEVIQLLRTKRQKESDIASRDSLSN